jgi:hypothetical protein
VNAVNEVCKEGIIILLQKAIKTKNKQIIDKQISYPTFTFIPHYHHVRVRGGQLKLAFEDETEKTTWKLSLTLYEELFYKLFGTRPMPESMPIISNFLKWIYWKPVYEIKNLDIAVLLDICADEYTQFESPKLAPHGLTHGNVLGQLRIFRLPNEEYGQNTQMSFDNIFYLKVRRNFITHIDVLLFIPQTNPRFSEHKNIEHIILLHFRKRQRPCNCVNTHAIIRPIMSDKQEEAQKPPIIVEEHFNEGMDGLDE